MTSSSREAQAYTPDEIAHKHRNVGERLSGLIEIARKMDDATEQIADKAWLAGTAQDVSEYADLAFAACERRDAELDSLRAAYHHACEELAGWRLAQVREAVSPEDVADVAAEMLGKAREQA